jgi:voltage-gated potassium channel
MTTENPKRELPVGYQVTMLALSVYALVTLVFQWLGHKGSETVKVLDYADRVLCAVFFVDFLISTWMARDRWKYFRTWGWLDLISSLPLDAAKFGRLARVVRIVRVFRALRLTRTMFSRLVEQRTQNTLLAAGVSALMLLILASVAVLFFETAPESNITTARDAIWWAITTMTTVGYGDRFPVTVGGRVVAAVLMISGIGLFGVLSGLLAAWFVSPQDKADERALASIKEDLTAIRRELENIRQKPGP